MRHERTERVGAMVTALVTLALMAHPVAQGAKPAQPLSGVPLFKADPNWPVLPKDFTWG